MHGDSWQGQDSTVGARAQVGVRHGGLHFARASRIMRQAEGRVFRVLFLARATLRAARSPKPWSIRRARVGSWRRVPDRTRPLASIPTQSTSCSKVARVARARPTRHGRSGIHALGLRDHGVRSGQGGVSHFQGKPIQAHWGMPDPAEVQGGDVAKRVAFSNAFALISRRIDLLLELPVEKLDRLVLEAKTRAIGAVFSTAGPS